MTELISSNKIKPRDFHSEKRFTDDLCAVINSGEFGALMQKYILNSLNSN